MKSADDFEKPGNDSARAEENADFADGTQTRSAQIVEKKSA